MWLEGLEDGKAPDHLCIAWQQFWETYFRRYVELRSFKSEDFRKWQIVAVTASRGLGVRPLRPVTGGNRSSQQRLMAQSIHGSTADRFSTDINSFGGFIIGNLERIRSLAIPTTSVMWKSSNQRETATRSKIAVF
jgi:hypothetical protein